MKAGGLITAVVVLGILGGLVWYTGKHPVNDKKTDTPVAVKLISVDPAQMEGIRIAKAGEEPIVLKKVADIWEITEPKHLGADSEMLGPLTGALSAISSDRVIDEHPASLKEFGLETPGFEVDVTAKGGKVYKLLTGSETPGSGKVYAKLADDPKVYTVPSSIRSSVDKSLNDLRDKRMMTFNQNKLKSMTLAAKGPAFEFAKNEQLDWQIVKPRALRADALQAQDLVRKLIDTRMDLTGNYDEADAAKQFAAGAKIAVATATDDKQTQTLEVRKAKDGSYYAKSSAVENIYKVMPDIAEGLNKSVEDYRDKRIFDFGFTDPSKLEINGQAYEKSGEKWTANQVQFDPATIQNVIDKIRDLSAAKFSEKVAGTKTLTLAITSGEKKRIEKVTINKDGDAFNAHREGEAPVYVIESKSTDELQKAISAIKQQMPAKAPAVNQDKKK